jgi:hypothetical protein
LFGLVGEFACEVETDADLARSWGCFGVFGRVASGLVSPVDQLGYQAGQGLRVQALGGPERERSADKFLGLAIFEQRGCL